ncbi:hypothetical protein LCGC14_1807700 [marine sediment metagenome]|uniref:Uncharacterized protein n=1 Tax=marine sediment metagenome TaxID=412755 RepID=A0A0F9JME0_9ZZZZ
MSDFETIADLKGVEKVFYKDKLYNVGNSWDDTVELFRNGEFSFTVDVKSLKKVKQPKGKTKRERTMKKATASQIRETLKLTKKEIKEAKEAVEQYNHKKQKEKKYVLLEDIVIKAGTVFYDSGETTFHDHYESHMAFGPNHVGNFLVEKEMLEKSIGDKTEEIEFSFTELIE